MLPAAVFSLLAVLALPAAYSQSSDSSSSAKPGKNQSSSSQVLQQEKAPSLIDPAGPTISLTSSEPVFLMAAALNACGYDEGLEESDPVRKRVRDEMNDALARSEDARNKRDKVCLYIAQHRMTGSQHDIAQYISLALYLTPPPELATSVELQIACIEHTRLHPGGGNRAPAERLCCRHGPARHLACGASHLR